MSSSDDIVGDGSKPGEDFKTVDARAQQLATEFSSLWKRCLRATKCAARGKRVFDYDTVLSAACEVFLVACRRIETGRPITNAILYRIAQRRLVDEIRPWRVRFLRRAVQRWQALSARREYRDDPEFRDGSYEHDAARTRSDGRNQRVRDAIERLSERLRIVVVLHIDDGLTLEEIGRHIGLTREGVRARWRKALDLLRRSLHRDLGIDGASCA